MKTAALALAILLIAGCTARPRPILSHQPDPAPPQSGCADFVYSLFGSRVGWSRMTESVVKVEGRQLTYSRTQHWSCINRGEPPAQFVKTMERWLTPDGSVVRALFTEVEGGNTRRVEMVWAETVKFTQSRNGGPASVTEVKPDGKPVYSDKLAVEAIVSSNTEPGARFTFQAVDIEDAKLFDMELVVVGRTSKLTPLGQVVEGIGAYCPHAGGDDFLLFRDNGDMLLGDYATGIVMERVDRIPSPFFADPVFPVTGMATSASIEDLRGLREMEVEFALADPLTNRGEPLLRSCAYQDVRLFERGYALKLKAQFPTDVMLRVLYPPPGIPREAHQYLGPSRMCESDDLELAAEAMRMMQGRQTTAAAVAELSTFVRNRLTRGDSGLADAASARTAYDARKGDCTEFAALLAALARAAGIPARLCVGMMYAAPAEVAFRWHAWVEVWIGEWIPMDATRTDFGASARYIFVSHADSEDEFPEGSMTKLARARFATINSCRLESGAHWQRPDAPSYFTNRK